MSAFWGVASTDMVLISGILKGDLFTNVYNMRLFLITKILSLEEKRVIFKAEIHNIMSMPIINDKYRNSSNLDEYVSEYISDKVLPVYDTSLTLLREATTIKLYADEIVFSLMNEINNVKQDMNFIKNIAYAALLILVVFIDVSLIRWFFEDIKLVEGAQTNIGQIALASITAQVIDYIKQEVPPELVSDAVRVVFDKVTQDITKLQERLTEMDKGLNDLSTSIIELSKAKQ
jgi:hypothetical protein